MQKLLTAFQDDTGNFSMMRLVVFMVVFAVLASAFYNAWVTKTTVVFTDNDFKLIGGAVAGKLFQNSQENAPAPPKA